MGVYKRNYGRMDTQCVFCGIVFRSEHPKTKSCSDECRRKHRISRHRLSREKLKKTYTCKYCKKDFIRYRERGGFCNQSCVSRFHIELGTFDKWRYRINPRQGINKNCIICNKEFYAEPAEIETKRFCGSRECKKVYMSEHMSKNSPLIGTKTSEETKQKIKETLKKRYGIENAHAYALAKHVSLSKPQREITKYLSENTNYTILSDFPLRCKETNKYYQADIIIKELKLIIEFNGTYWHADSRFYKETDLIKKKQKTAKEIWSDDEKRLNSLGKWVMMFD